VPLALSHPAPSLAYTLSDAQACLVFAEDAFMPLLSPIASEKNIALLSLERSISEHEYKHLPKVATDQIALLLYTSGTTSTPKGVAISHFNLQAQAEMLSQAWAWQPDDYILNPLPLHHVHGLINIAYCALWNGACLEFIPKFDAYLLWNRLIHSPSTLFMAVPTIYAKLIEYWTGLYPEEQETHSKALHKLRLMVSGSAALPISLLEKWRSISGHTLLERYGMTETGMILSNPYQGDRRAGTVGKALPGIQARLVNEKGEEVPEGETGEIQVKGPSVFHAYWNRQEASLQAFTPDGWFKTGDLATVEHDGYYRILGRISTDIIKTGGYKVSALEVEEVLRRHPAIDDCAVLGIPDHIWGEAVVVTLIAHRTIGLEALREWAKAQLPAYKVPTQLRYIDEFPKNAMGKVLKNELKKLFE
jgi:malonyl-CoA/methylmalonyl-CoA synthetase